MNIICLPYSIYFAILFFVDSGSGGFHDNPFGDDDNHADGTYDNHSDPFFGNFGGFFGRQGRPPFQDPGLSPDDEYDDTESPHTGRNRDNFQFGFRFSENDMFQHFEEMSRSFEELFRSMGMAEFPQHQHPCKLLYCS